VHVCLYKGEYALVYIYEHLCLYLVLQKNLKFILGFISRFNNDIVLVIGNLLSTLR